MTGLDRDLLSLLEARIGWKQNTGKDSFGNETYATTATIEAFISSQNQTFGSGDSDQAEQKIVTGGTLIVNYHPVEVQDVLVIDGTEMYVVQSTVFRDETGVPLYQEVTVSSEKRG